MIDTPAAPAKTTRLLPDAGASGAPLMVVIAILAFMASTALCGYFMVSHAAKSWTGDLMGTVTIQVKGIDQVMIEQQAVAAEALLERTAGVIKLQRLTREESEALLEPWLGKGNLSADFPVPSLISADITPNLRKNLEGIRTALARVAPDATLDDHGQWNERLIGAARRTQSVAFLVFMMVMVAAAAVIIFATRAGLAAHRNIVEVMHLVGATDQFIAKEVQQRYLILGLKGGILGAVFAAFILFSAARFAGKDPGFFLPNLGADPSMLLWLFVVPFSLCLIAAITAHFTVLRVLHRQ